MCLTMSLLHLVIICMLQERFADDQAIHKDSNALAVEEKERIIPHASHV